MYSATCLSCDRPTTHGDLLCQDCIQLRPGEAMGDAPSAPSGAGAPAAGSAAAASRAQVCMLMQREGHPTVRVFAQPVGGAPVIGEIPSGHAVRCTTRQVDFLRVLYRQLDGWVGVKNVIRIADATTGGRVPKERLAGSDGQPRPKMRAKVAQVPGAPPTGDNAPAPPPSPHPGDCRAAYGAPGPQNWSCTALPGSPASSFGSLPSIDDEESGTSTALPRNASSMGIMDFGLSLDPAPRSLLWQLHRCRLPEEESFRSLLGAVQTVAGQIRFLELRVHSNRELAACRGKFDSLEPYTPFADVPQEAKLELVRASTAVAVAARSIGAMVGMAVADALGAPFEFMDAVDFPKPRGPYLDLASLKIVGHVRNKFRVRPGQWTDDTSMGLCLADSLLARGEYDGSDVRVRFHNWWFRGYNNAFRNDRKRVGSVGLGGNISKSLAAMRAGQVPTARYDAQSEDSGNGSLMRLAPVPIFFSHDPVLAAQVSAESSRSTHPGGLAAACCAFFGFAIAKAIHRAREQTAQEFLDGVVEAYRAAGMPGAEGCRELGRLLRSAEPTGCEQCWNWRAEALQVERSLRARGSKYNGYPCTAGYFGSYCIDGLAIALWSFYHTDSFLEAVVRCINFLGDSDTTAAICGQLAGAFYGYPGIDVRLLERLAPWDDHDVACRGALLWAAGSMSGV